MQEIDAITAAEVLDDLLDAVLQGESFAITRHGRRIARLEPAEAGPNQIEAAEKNQPST
jgi:antitoxin (DNA-binding transcriptional repressor) of toxin-antitoxin stability system